MTAAGSAAPKVQLSQVVRLAVASGATPVVGILVAPILARALGVQGRGELAGALAPLLLAASLFGFGITDAATNFVARRPGLTSFVLRAGLSVVIPAGVLASAAIALLANFFSNGETAIAGLAVLAGATASFYLALAVVRSIAAGLRFWHLINAERYFVAFSRLALFAVLAVFGLLSLQAAVFVSAFVPLLGGLFYVPLLSQLRRTAWSRKRRRAGEAKVRKALVGYGSRAWVGSLAGVLLSRLDQALLIPLSNATQLGLYALAVSIGEVVLLGSVAVRDLVTSADAARSDNEQAQRASRLVFAGSLIVGAAIYLVSAKAVPFIFGKEFAGSVPVIGVILVACISGIPGSLAGAVLTARGRPGARSLGLVVAALVNIGGLVLLVPSGGALGAAWATLAGNVMAASFNLFCVRVFFAVRVLPFVIPPWGGWRKEGKGRG